MDLDLVDLQYQVLEFKALLVVRAVLECLFVRELSRQVVPPLYHPRRLSSRTEGEGMVHNILLG